jgi:hypothetical protein
MGAKKCIAGPSVLVILAAITNYHGLSSFRNKSLFLAVYRLDIQDQGRYQYIRF